MPYSFEETIPADTYYTDGEMEQAVSVAIGAAMVANRYLDEGTWSHQSGANKADVYVEIRCSAGDADLLMSAFNREYRDCPFYDVDLATVDDDEAQVIITVNYELQG